MTRSWVAALTSGVLAVLVAVDALVTNWLADNWDNGLFVLFSALTLLIAALEGLRARRRLAPREGEPATASSVESHHFGDKNFTFHNYVSNTHWLPLMTLMVLVAAWFLNPLTAQAPPGQHPASPSLAQVPASAPPPTATVGPSSTPSPSPTSTTRRVTPPTGSVWFTDEFVDNSKGRWSNYVLGETGPTDSVVDGTLHLETGAPLVLALSETLIQLTQNPVDTRTEFDLFNVRGRGEVGVLCREYSDSGYKFAIRDTGYVSIGKVREKNVERIPGGELRPTMMYRPADHNKVVASCVTAGDSVRLELSINGVTVAAVTDASNPLIRGFNGFHAAPDSGQMISAEFDNLVVRTP